MFCPNCGNQVQEGQVCVCGFNTQQVLQPQQGQPGEFSQQFSAFAKAATNRFGINQLISFGALFLMIFAFIFVFAGGVGVYSMMFNTGGNFGVFFVTFLPLILIVLFTFIMKGQQQSLVNLCISASAAMYPLSFWFSGYAGFGAFLCFFLWAIIAAAWFMEYKGIKLFKI